jgi:hypothetical protein
MILRYGRGREFATNAISYSSGAVQKRAPVGSQKRLSAFGRG